MRDNDIPYEKPLRTLEVLLPMTEMILCFSLLLRCVVLYGESLPFT